MTRPNLADPAQRALYRKELRRLYRGWRWFGLALVLIAVWLLAWPRMGGPWMAGPVRTQYLGWALLAAGWAILGIIILKRTRYHQARMREPE